MDSATDVVDQAHILIDGVKTFDKDILAELCTEANSVSTEVRNCLRAYKLNVSTMQLKHLLNPFKKL